jgi:transcriptional regulator with XRE-family HTH domain
MTIGEKIYKLRSEKGISQETMSFDLGVSRQAVSKWETDQSLPDLDKIKLLSEYFKVSIDYLVKDIEIDKINQTIENIHVIEEEKNKKYDSNKIKRIVRIMLKTSIALTIMYFVYYLICVFGQSYIPELGRNGTFVFPTVDFIKKLIQCLFIIVIAFIMLKRLKKDTSSSLFELVTLISYLIGSWLILSVIFPSIEQQYINSLDYNVNVIENIQITYLKLVNYISKFSVYLTTTTILLELSLIIMIIVRKFDTTKYILPTEVKNYKTIDSVLSFLNGLFLGLPGLLFQIIWLLDARSDNKFRFKKMFFWYIIGCVIGIIIHIIFILINLV